MSSILECESNGVVHRDIKDENILGKNLILRFKKNLRHDLSAVNQVILMNDKVYSIFASTWLIDRISLIDWLIAFVFSESCDSRDQADRSGISCVLYWR